MENPKSQSCLTHAVLDLTAELKQAFVWFRVSHGFATKKDLLAMEKRLAALFMTSKDDQQKIAAILSQVEVNKTKLETLKIPDLLQ